MPAQEKDFGVVFNIQHYSVQDGPGIRTTFFLKGCNLGCAWCSNPESQSLSPEVAHRDSLCDHCGACLEVCEPKAIAFIDQGVKIDRERCTNCGKCVEICTRGALTIYGEKTSAQKICAEVSRDTLYYRNSDGGVTASGGEPLLQPYFLRNLFSMCQDSGIHTTLDTAGYVDPSTFPNVLEYTDLVLYDLKCMDTEIHRKYTGVPNGLILENAERVVASGTRVDFRIPLIEGVNDSVENITRTCDFAITLNVPRLDLLPYHKFGLGKYTSLDLKQPDDFHTPPKEHIENLVRVVTSYGIACTIGG
ncbi:glycyl-radical enzyme activating protein [Chloroflexota bacterium]